MDTDTVRCSCVAARLMTEGDARGVVISLPVDDDGIVSGTSSGTVTAAVSSVSRTRLDMSSGPETEGKLLKWCSKCIRTSIAVSRN